MEHAPKTFVCPKCYTKNRESATECSCCGIVFAKYEIAKILSLDEALNEYKKNNFSKARKLLWKHLEQYSEDEKVKEYIEEATFKEAVAAFHSNQLEHAVELFIKLQTEFPERADEAHKYIEEATFQQAVDAFNRFKFKQAEALFTEVLENSFDRNRADEVKNYIARIDKFHNRSKIASNENFAIEVLTVLAWLSFIAGASAALFSLIQGNLVSFLLFLFAGVYGCTVLLVLCSIAKSLIEIRKNTSRTR